MEFKAGQRVIAVANGLDYGRLSNYYGEGIEVHNYSIGYKGTVQSVHYDSLDIDFDGQRIIKGCSSSSFMLLDEFPMDYKEAFKVMIDGKTVEDEEGVLLKFVAPKFYYKYPSDTGFSDVSGVPWDSTKFREYTPKPKFKQGQIVEYEGNEYVRIAKVNNDLTYVITGIPNIYNDGTAFRVVSEDGLKEVQ